MPHVMLQVCDEEVEESETNFLVLVQTLLKDPAEREHFFQVRCIVTLFCCTVLH